CRHLAANDVDEIATGRGLADVEKEIACLRETAAVVTQDVALNVGKVEFPAHASAFRRVLITPGSWVGAEASIGLCSARNCPNAAWSASSSKPWVAIANCVNCCCRESALRADGRLVLGAVGDGSAARCSTGR